MSRWDGMKDGDEQTVELPFGEAVFLFEAGDRSVGWNGGVYITELIVNGYTFDREELERVKAGPANLADMIDRWAANQ